MFDINANVNSSEMKVALLAGGTSAEREISLSSEKGARAALEEAGFQVTTLDPSKDKDLQALMTEPFDVAFLVTHGKGGEDGSLQGFLETIGLPYTCSGVAASAISMDKDKTKLVYREAGVPTAENVTIFSGDDVDAGKIAAKLGDKVVVKAATEGSSIGVYIVEGENEIESAIEQALELDDTVVVESFKQGREFTVVVLDAPGPKALPIIEIVPKNASYDFESKYAPGGSEHVCPAPLKDKEASEMSSFAVAAHKALGCAGVSRTDFIMNEDGEMWALETNTIPGMTQTSLLPDAARAAGMEFSELVTVLIANALARQGKAQ